MKSTEVKIEYGMRKDCITNLSVILANRLISIPEKIKSATHMLSIKEPLILDGFSIL